MMPNLSHADVDAPTARTPSSAAVTEAPGIMVKGSFPAVLSPEAILEPPVRLERTIDSGCSGPLTQNIRIVCQKMDYVSGFPQRKLGCFPWQGFGRPIASTQ